MSDRTSRLIYTALSQLGVTETRPNDVLYNTWYYGKTVWDSAGTGAYAWCVVFLSWCAHQVGLTKAIPKENNVSNLMRYYQGCGRYYSCSRRMPQAGDLIFFSSGSGRHVGLVLASDGKGVATVEGNTSNAVRIRQYPLTDGSIVGWAVPDYDSCTDTKSEKEELNLIKLKQGDRGEAVRALQIRLLYEGYQLGSYGPKKDGADGDFGSKTRAAVMDYQKKQGLLSDGIAGCETLSRLYGLS